MNEKDKDGNRIGYWELNDEINHFISKGFYKHNRKEGRWEHIGKGSIWKIDYKNDIQNYSVLYRSSNQTIGYYLHNSLGAVLTHNEENYL